MGFLKLIKDYILQRRRARLLKKRLAELRKRDPFIYK
jgi:hypothetical protein